MRLIIVILFLAAVGGPAFPDAVLTSTLAGEWSGMHYFGLVGAARDRLEIRSNHSGISAVMTVSYLLTSGEVNQFLASGVLSPRAKNLRSIGLFRIEMDVTLSGRTVMLKPRVIDVLYTYSSVDPVMFRLTLGSDNRLTGFSTILKPKKGMYWDKKTPWNPDDYIPDQSTQTPVVFEKQGTGYPRPAFDLSRGGTITVKCLDAPEVTYSCFIPSGYDPAKPVHVIINDSPAGKASPLAVKAAEELGWISVGLPGKYDATGFLVIRDLYRRFKIAPKGLYFCGFSEGAKRNSERITYYPDETGGLVDIDMGSGTPLDIPVAMLVANREGRGDYRLAGKWKTGKRWQIVMVYNDYHTWGPVELHNAAVRWLAQIRALPGYFSAE